MPETTTTAVVSEQHTLQIPSTAKELIEALIFAAEEPLSLEQIRRIYQESATEERRDLKENEIETIISVLNDEFQQANKPYRIIRIAGGYQFATLAEYAEWIGKLYKEQGRRKLSQSSLETLAIIAYRQPIIRPDIEAIRGVDCDYVLGTLLEKKLISIVGRAPTPGRPLLYGTTEHFLKHFGLNVVSDLPRPREIEELLADARYETERRMLEAEEQAEKDKKEAEDFKSRLPHIPKKKVEMDDSVAIVPKKPGRSLNVRRADETQEMAQQERIESNEAKQIIEQQAEVSEIVDQNVTQVPPVDAVLELPIEQVSVGETSIDTPVNAVPMSVAPEGPEETLKTGLGSELIEQTKPAEIEQAQSVPKETEEVAAVEHSIEEDAQADEIITMELRLTETQKIPPQEETHEVMSSEEKVPPDIEMRQADVAEENQDTRSRLEEPHTEVVQEDEIPQEERPEPAESNVSSTERSPAATMNNFEEVAQEQHPKELTPPFEVAESSNKVTLPLVAPIVDEVREPIQPKSRWRQIKEKIQGFIKKVFG